jgi:hypothetical protein
MIRESIQTGKRYFGACVAGLAGCFRGSPDGGTSRNDTAHHRAGAVLVLLGLSTVLLVVWGGPLIVIKYHWLFAMVGSLTAAAGLLLVASPWKRWHHGAVILVACLFAGAATAYVIPLAPTARRILPHAVIAGDTHVVGIALDHGADPSDPGLLGIPPLHLAAIAGEAEAARLLLEAGVDVDRRGSRGATALHLAATEGNLTVVRTLVERGADTEAQGPGGLTAAQMADRTGHEEVAEYLRQLRKPE